MSGDEKSVAKDSALQFIRTAISSRNLTRLKEGMQRPWSLDIIKNTDKNAVPSAVYRIFHEALEGMQKEERQKAFQWTWDCYHPYMSDLGKVLEDLDGYRKKGFF